MTWCDVPLRLIRFIHEAHKIDRRQKLNFLTLFKSGEFIQAYNHSTLELMSNYQDPHLDSQNESNHFNRGDRPPQEFNPNYNSRRNHKYPNQHRSANPNEVAEFHHKPRNSHNKSNAHHSYNSNKPRNFNPSNINSSNQNTSNELSGSVSENPKSVSSFSPTSIPRNFSPANIVSKPSNTQNSATVNTQFPTPPKPSPPDTNPKEFQPIPTNFTPQNNQQQNQTQTHTEQQNQSQVQQKVEIQCPICSDKHFTFYSEVIYHIIQKHKLSAVMKSIIDSNYQCKFCNRLLNTDDEIVIKHMFDDHRKEFFDQLRAAKPKRDQRLNNFLNKVLTIPEKSRELFKKIDCSDAIGDDDDTDYAAFIASTIQTKGVIANENIVINDIQEVSGQKIEKIDHDFWTALNTLDQKLRAQSTTPIEDHCSCPFCHKKLNSYVKLLAHCWGTHDQLLK